MNLRLIYKLTGYFSILIGIGAALCIYRPGLMVFGMAFTIIGFILAIINIFLNSKYFSEEEKYPKGLIGMFLSSLPVWFMLLKIMKHHR